MSQNELLERHPEERKLIETGNREIEHALSLVQDTLRKERADVAEKVEKVKQVGQQAKIIVIVLGLASILGVGFIVLRKSRIF